MVQFNAPDENEGLTSFTDLISAVAPISEMTPLNKKFQSGSKDVICGRGRKNFDHVGNFHFRAVVASFLHRYSNASCKLENSLIVSSILKSVRVASPDGGFVKQDLKSGRWYEVGDRLAREKIGQAFRDALHTQYSSSTVAKKNKRIARKIANSKVRPVNRVLKSKQNIKSDVEELSTDVEELSTDVKSIRSEHKLGDMFSTVNFNVLMEMNLMAESKAPFIHSVCQML